MSSNISKKLLTCTAIATIMAFSIPQAQAGDVSVAIEAGGTVNIDGADTFVIDSTNDGEPGGTAVITFADDATNGNDSLTISGDDTDNVNFANLAEIDSVVVLDNNGTNTLTITGTTGNTLQSGSLWLRVGGDINGDVATDANDLRIIIDATTSAFDNNSIMLIEGDINLGSGQVTLTGDANNQARLSYDASSSQVVNGSIISTTDDVGSFIIIINRNAAGTITFNDAIGAEGSGGIASIAIGANTTFNSTVDGDDIDIDANAASTTADFNGNVTGGTIAVEGGGTGGALARFSGDVDVTSITLDFETGGAEAVFDSSTAQNVTGLVRGASNGEGLVTIATGADVTFNSVIGGGANDLDNFAVQTNAAATFTQDVGTQQDGNADIGLNVDGTLSLNTAGNNVTYTENTGDVDIDGTLNVTGANSATVTAASDLFIDGTLSTVLSGAARTLSLTGVNSMFIGASSDTTITAGNQIVTGSDVTIGAGGTSTVFNVRRTADFDPTMMAVMNAAGDIVTVGGSLEVGIDASSLDFDIGDTVTVIDSDTNAGTSYATLVGNDTITFRDTAFLDLQDDGSDAQDLKFIIAAKADVDGASEQTSGVLDNAVAATAGDAEARAAILSLSAGETNDAGLQMLQDTTGGAATTQANAGNMVTGFDMVSSRLSNIRGSGPTGLSSGDQMSERTYWVRAFGTTADQDMRSGVQGYEADTVGVMVGGDVMLDNDVRIGVNASYAVTDVETDGSGDHETDIDTYRIGVYGGKDFENCYVEGQASVAYNDIETSRNITFGGLNRIANGDTDGYEYGLRVGAGMPLAIDASQTITPYTNFQYIHADVDGYTESGASSLNIRTDDQDIDIAELAIGARYNADIDYSEGTLKPEIRAAAAYDFIGETSESTQQFTGGGSTFTTKGPDVAQFSVNYGAGVSWETKDQSWEFSLDYDGKAKSDYITHGARLEAKLRF
jgi:outer membrane autotransporter protein